MPLDVARTRQYIRNFDFTTLFIEELGWDYHEQKLLLPIDDQTYALNAVAQKRSMVAFECACSIPDYATRRKIERQLAKSVHEHLIIYTDKSEQTQRWQWVKREVGKPAACREHRYDCNQPGDLLIQKLQSLAFAFEEEEDLTIVDVTRRVRAAFDVDRVTKHFYDRFKSQHAAFLKFIEGIPDEGLQRWYASVMLNRLMFIYFIQKKGFLNDDLDYLHTKMVENQLRGRDRFYIYFLCPLFFEGFAKKESERSQGTQRLLGKVPYLNGGIFLRHQIEELHGEQIHIADTAFEKLFDFFEQYQWHLDERPLRADNEINPDVLGYIFEKYINQKQMGAYYTKEDITDYISRNTVIPFIFDVARQKCRIAFEGGNSVWQLLQSDPDRYIYGDMKKGVELPLPQDISAGLSDVSKRAKWNEPASSEYALPTESWREVIDRCRRYEEVWCKLADGNIRDINDFITYNLDICQFAQDVIESCEGPELLRAFWYAVENVTILDPACGSGAFLFAALNILEPLYEACLERMEAFLSELDVRHAFSDSKISPTESKKDSSQKFSDFRRILNRVSQHASPHYFILKSIILNNLFGVDIMEEAVEICKLRLFLKLVAQIERVEDIEPLPDIDFNIRAGNTLVGFVTFSNVEEAVNSKLDFDRTMERISEKAQDIDHLSALFRQQQTELGGEVTPGDKQELSRRLGTLEDELNHYLVGEYGTDNSAESYRQWLASHKPFHWFIEFYSIMRNGGFDIIIGNPPYVEYKDVRPFYEVHNYRTEKCSNLFAYMIERCSTLAHGWSRLGIIIPLSAFSTDRMIPLVSHVNCMSSIVSIANFSWRPGKLFDGVNLQLSILLQTLGESAPRVETTRYLLWDSEARSELFSSKIEFSLTQDRRLPGAIPKLGTTEAASILQKLRAQRTEIVSCFVGRSSNKVFYRRGGLYWKVFVDFETGSSEEKVIYLFPEIDKYSIIAALSSSLWFWYYTITSDCRHLGRRDINTFPFDPRDMHVALRQKLCKLGLEYVSDLKLNAEPKVRVYKERTPVECLSFKVKESKRIIDEIDRVLAQHYSFTDEELDFIINYDIKYRMGGEIGEDNE